LVAAVFQMVVDHRRGNRNGGHAQGGTSDDQNYRPHDAAARPMRCGSARRPLGLPP
jgi:hypothetical protein